MSELTQYQIEESSRSKEGSEKSTTKTPSYTLDVNVDIRSRVPTKKSPPITSTQFRFGEHFSGNPSYFQHDPSYTESDAAMLMATIQLTDIASQIKLLQSELNLTPNILIKSPIKDAEYLAKSGDKENSSDIAIKKAIADNELEIDTLNQEVDAIEQALLDIPNPHKGRSKVNAYEAAIKHSQAYKLKPLVTQNYGRRPSLTRLLNLVKQLDNPVAVGNHKIWERINTIKRTSKSPYIKQYLSHRDTIDSLIDTLSTVDFLQRTCQQIRRKINYLKKENKKHHDTLKTKPASTLLMQQFATSVNSLRDTGAVLCFEFNNKPIALSLIAANEHVKILPPLEQIFCEQNKEKRAATDNSTPNKHNEIKQQQIEAERRKVEKRKRKNASNNHKRQTINAHIEKTGNPDVSALFQQQTSNDDQSTNTANAQQERIDIYVAAHALSSAVLATKHTANEQHTYKSLAQLQSSSLYNQRLNELTKTLKIKNKDLSERELIDRAIKIIQEEFEAEERRKQEAQHEKAKMERHPHRANPAQHNNNEIHSAVWQSTSDGEMEIKGNKEFAHGNTDIAYIDALTEALQPYLSDTPSEIYIHTQDDLFYGLLNIEGNTYFDAKKCEKFLQDTEYKTELSALENALLTIQSKAQLKLIYHPRGEMKLFKNNDALPDDVLSTAEQIAKNEEKKRAQTMVHVGREALNQVRKYARTSPDKPLSQQPNTGPN